MRVFWWKDCGDIRRFEVYLYAVVIVIAFKMAEGQTGA